MNLNIKNFFIDYNYDEKKPANFNYKIKHLIDFTLKKFKAYIAVDIG